ncbi:MAG: sigma-54-dependent Fis family transcriptional regulator [Rhodobacter sp.]|uniref:sigma-54-dependent transcriptional regulator n=1 Tax=Pararhodobacter sp. TaxID=2127056 RepID=UPI002C36F85F|nr:sigma-54 dependent transcriptional regulator [Pararhodobacter sp.]MCC0071968.1 sigma-54-dependent Fis family transcriptional regulator [Rhodobacter sp.]HPD93104.1 sigma-54 dependent transcriptional regulator [Pararhodobacter sp.]
MTKPLTSDTILLIEDTPSLQMIYKAALNRAGFTVETCGTAAEGTAAFQRLKTSIVLLDLMLPDRAGLDVMQDLLVAEPRTCVIVITANGSINKAVEMMRAGAHEFLVKPFDDQRLIAAVENARKALRHRPQPLHAPRGEAPARQVLPPFIGHSEPMQAVYEKIRSVARSMATVFVTGESGTGKELCAEAVHQASARASGPFVALNCGAIPVDLLESEVFGHLRGSFTGAISDKLGAAAAADGGTLFLDEICEMDLNLQTKLLRFLQTSTITPVGATRPRKVNVRIICATNRDPAEEVRRGRFREDLYYRLHVVPIHLPPLRDRGDDVNEIADALISQMGREENHDFQGLSPRVRELFRALPWPGNVRQLINVLRNVVVLNDGPHVTPEMLPPDLLAIRAAPAPAAGERSGLSLGDLAGRTLAQIERIVIEDALARHGDSVPKAARELDVSASTLYRKREAWAKADEG